MLTLANGQATLLCERREFLRAGSGMAAVGFSLPSLLWPRPAAAKPAAARDQVAGGAKSCILVYLLGGPPQLDTFDLKPGAPAEIRGPFQPISTTVPGVEICELLPLLAQMAGSYVLVRSVSHRNSNHTPMIYYTLTGRQTAQPERDNDVRPPQPGDFPHLGAVLSKFKPSAASLPGYVAVPELAIRSSIAGPYKRARTPLRGGGPGFLGAGYAPLAVQGDPRQPEAIPALTLPPNVTLERFERRATLLSLLDGRVPRVTETQTLHDVRSQALLLTGSSNRDRLRVFSLDEESPEVRERYGPHRFGQSLLLARRLAEAGVPMIAIHFNEMTVCDGWDTHSQNFQACREELLPMLDQALSALLEDLHARGTLDETLIVCMGEFGRTPKINANAGRDHWGECSSVLLAGGGIRGGQVLGSSDGHAAWPASHPVDPVDIQATIYHCMGLDPHLAIHDRAQRPWEISTGKVLRELL
ncbi:MAG: DUF1501 domain-containing protein [Planctomycetes bacterium]|nr:DUF1501 domain-containing protein [Planctomycetota bacterium]